MQASSAQGGSTHESYCILSQSTHLLSTQPVALFVVRRQCGKLPVAVSLKGYCYHSFMCSTFSLSFSVFSSLSCFSLQCLLFWVCILLVPSSKPGPFSGSLGLHHSEGSPIWQPHSLSPHSLNCWLPITITPV